MLLTTFRLVTVQRLTLAGVTAVAVVELELLLFLPMHCNRSFSFLPREKAEQMGSRRFGEARLQFRPSQPHVTSRYNVHLHLHLPCRSHSRDCSVVWLCDKIGVKELWQKHEPNIHKSVQDLGELC